MQQTKQKFVSVSLLFGQFQFFPLVRKGPEGAFSILILVQIRTYRNPHENSLAWLRLIICFCPGYYPRKILWAVRLKILVQIRTYRNPHENSLACLRLIICFCPGYYPRKILWAVRLKIFPLRPKFFATNHPHLKNVGDVTKFI